MALRKRRPGLVYPVWEDWRYVGEAGEPAFGTGVSNISSAAALAFRIREAGAVDIQGVVETTTTHTLFTLPVGYRPSAIVHIPITGANFSGPDQSVSGMLRVGSDGVVAEFFYDAATRIFPEFLYVYAQVFLDPPVAAP